jgi:diaminopimelate decarboxylase
VLAAGGDPRKTLFSGVGKSEAEIRFALEKRVGCINLESESELKRVSSIAEGLGTKAPVAFRVNPDIDARTHEYISTGLPENKFGVAHAEAERLYAAAAAMPGIEVVGIGCHIGSQLTQAAPFAEAAARIATLVDRLERSGIRLQHRHRRGIGIRYRDESQEPVSGFLAAALGMLARRGDRDRRSRPFDRW